MFLNMILMLQACEGNHAFNKSVPSIAFKIFNLMAKNYISEVKNKIHGNKKRIGY